MGLVTKHIELQTTYWLLVENVQGAFLDVEIAQSHDIIFPVIFFQYIYTGWWFGTLFFHILGMSSSQLAFIFSEG